MAGMPRTTAAFASVEPEATRRYQHHLIEKREGARRGQVRRRPLGNGPTRDMEHNVQ
jgi:hypothetical protein